MKRLVLSILIASLVCSDALASELKTGVILNRRYNFTLARKELEYTLYIPKSYDNTKEYPLVVALHGLLSNPKQIIRYPNLQRLAEKHNYIVVAPMGYNDRGWYGSFGWRVGGSIPANLGELSEKDVLNVLAITRAELKIDERRVYLYGHSMGGGGSLHIAAKYPDQFAAVAVAAPAYYKPAATLKAIAQTPVFIVQGELDLLVRAAVTQRLVKSAKMIGLKVTYQEVAGGSHLEVAWNTLPKIFEFYNLHSRKQPAPAVPNAQPITKKNTIDR
ncbi:MAG: alpha/beta fold hydrolase [Planctomycetaceae bacterium]|nr:alpha/beta fold hydrolase [Planctomycetaceae bacterium]